MDKRFPSPGLSHVLALACGLGAMGCEDLEARCAGSGEPPADGGLGTGTVTPTCGDDKGRVPALEGSTLVQCGAEYWAVQTCARTAVGFTQCERSCAVVERAAPYCDANAEAQCSNGAAAVCEVVALPTEAQCTEMLTACSADERVVAPTASGTSYAGCAFSRAFTLDREVVGDSAVQ